VRRLPQSIVERLRVRSRDRRRTGAGITVWVSAEEHEALALLEGEGCLRLHVDPLLQSHRVLAGLELRVDEASIEDVEREIARRGGDGYFRGRAVTILGPTPRAAHVRHASRDVFIEGVVSEAPEIEPRLLSKKSPCVGDVERATP